MRPQEVQRGTIVLASCNAPWSTWRRCEDGEPTPWQIWNDAEEEWWNTEAWPLLVLPYPTVDDHPSVHKVRMHLPATTVCECGLFGPEAIAALLEEVEGDGSQTTDGGAE